MSSASAVSLGLSPSPMLLAPVVDFAHIQLERIDEKNPDGIGAHLRYRFTCRSDVLKVIKFVNHSAAVAGYNGLSTQEISDILSLYPDNHTAA